MDSTDPDIQKVFEYTFIEVGSKTIEGFHVRGSSSKETIDLNKTLQIFILHEKDLWFWRDDKIERIFQGVSNIKYFRDDQIFFQLDLGSGKS